MIHEPPPPAIDNPLQRQVVHGPVIQDPPPPAIDNPLQRQVHDPLIHDPPPPAIDNPLPGQVHDPPADEEQEWEVEGILASRLMHYKLYYKAQ